MTPEVKAAAERLRRVKNGERGRTVYGYDDEIMDDFMYRMLENAHVADLQRLSDAYIALFDTTKLSLDVLTAELGEPIQSRESSADGTLEYLWCVGNPVRDKWIEWAQEACWGKGVGRLETLGALRRLLSVVNDPNPDRSEER